MLRLFVSLALVINNVLSDPSPYSKNSNNAESTAFATSTASAIASSFANSSAIATSSATASASSSATSSSYASSSASATASTISTKEKCGPNQVYDVCPAACPPRTCQTKNIKFLCVIPPKPGDPDCPNPKCRCADNFFSNDEGQCVTRDECPTKTCGFNEVYVSCPAPSCANQTCENAGKIFHCPKIPSKYPCVGECRCKEGYYRNKIGQCLSEADCKKSEQCGKNKVYDICPSSCPPRNCKTKDALFKCKAPLLPGDPKCPPPRCRCADNYYSNDNGECVLKEECSTLNCGSNEVYVPCPVPTCLNQTCENIGKRINCPFIPANFPCKPECRCKEGYYRNKIGECISEEDCKKCPGKFEYFSCGNACDNICDRLSRESHANCPIVNIVCNPMCYCLEGYARDADKKCIPISQCPPECKENEEYSKNPNKVCRAKSCKDLGYPLSCLQLDKNNTDCDEPGCICQAGYVRNEDGLCIPAGDCPSCGGDPNAVTGCGNYCRRCSNYNSTNIACSDICEINGCECRSDYVYDAVADKCVLPTQCPLQCGCNEVASDCANSPCILNCATKDLNLACKPYPPGCKPGCVCADGYYRDSNGVCVAENKCPPVPNKTCGSNEVYVPCPIPTCANQTCENIGKKFSCPAIPADYPCIPKCRCKDGYYRNKIGQCISEADCKKCPGEFEYFACDNACDNICDRLSRESHANCPIVNIVCNPMCYCLEGYARDADKKCIPISQCPPECKENEEYSKCPNSVCRAKSCDDLGYPLPCLQLNRNSTDCGEPRCICQAGYVKNKNGLCIPVEDCPSCGGDPNAVTGCGTFCTTCDNYNETGRACPASCGLNLCDCRKNYVYDPRIKKCVRPEQCSSNPSKEPSDECAPKKKCGNNQIYEVCPSTCPPRTCSTKDIAFRCAEPLKPGNPDCPPPGCRCIDGFYKNDNNECVTKEQCPICKPNEVYSTCPGRECRAKTCDDLGFDLPCYTSNLNTTACGEPACICEDGFVKDKEGVCIPKKECPSCGGDPNARSGCGTFCNRCKKNVPCPKICRSNSCDCQTGYVYDDNTHKCVLPTQCTKTCGSDEEYQECPNRICRPKTCNDIGYPLPCFQTNAQNISCGHPDCICEVGFVKNDKGICIPSTSCPSCGGDPNAKSGCGVFCERCNNYKSKNRACILLCRLNSCDCKTGYVYDQIKKKCVLPEQCPCGPNEVRSDCANTDCVKEYCTQKDLNMRCSPNKQTCKPGCLCADGYLRAENGTCIPIEECPPNCGANEEYSTCANGGCDKRNCTQLLEPYNLIEGGCKGGCVCKSGYLRTAAGECVLESNCPNKEICPKPHQYYDRCPPACPARKCGTDDRLILCQSTEECGNPECRCEQGYYMTPFGDCVRLEDCPPQCGANEVLSKCGNNGCLPTCADPDRLMYCDPNPSICKPGCVCDNDYLRNDKGVCVPKDKCPAKCSENEVYDECPASCPSRTCKNKDRLEKCKAPLKPGDPKCPRPTCRCADGFYKNDNGKCVTKEQCPPKCGRNEVISKCGNNGCLPTCAEPDRLAYCDYDPSSCKPGCVCAKDYLRNDKGVCVPKDKCPAKCGENEVFDECPASCPSRTCKNKDRLEKCKAPLKPGDPKCPRPKCRCADGFYKNDDGKCVTKEQCPPKCGRNEVISECGNNGCLPTCAEPDRLAYCDYDPSSCKPGCVCAKDYLRNDKGVCVPKDKCPAKCGENEVYDECPASCPSRTCKNKDRLEKCKAPLKPGDPKCPRPTCRCADGFYKNDDGKCVTKEQCPPICGCNEVPSDCATNICLPDCAEPQRNLYCKPNPANCKPGCICADGYLKNSDGICVLKDKCSPCDTD